MKANRNANNAYKIAAVQSNAKIPRRFSSCFSKPCFGDNQVSHNYITFYFLGIVSCFKYFPYTNYKPNNKNYSKVTVERVVECILYIYDQIQSSDFDEGHWLRSHIFNQLLYLQFLAMW